MYEHENSAMSFGLRYLKKRKEKLKDKKKEVAFKDHNPVSMRGNVFLFSICVLLLQSASFM